MLLEKLTFGITPYPAQLQVLPEFVFYFTYGILKHAENILQAKDVDCVLSLMSSSAEGTEWDPQPLAL